MIEIIKAQENHIPEIADLWMGFMRFHQNMDPVYEPPENSIPVFIDEFLLPAMEDENSLVLSALDGDRVIGYSYSLIVEPHKLNKRNKYGIVHDMFIAAEYRNKGIGKNMFSIITDWFRLNNIDRVEVDVMTENKVASTFWEQRGFKNLNRTLFLHL